MAKTRKKYSAEFKLKAVLEILKGEKTAAQLSGELEVHPLVLSEWKKRFKEAAPEIFEKPKKTSKIKEEEKEKSELYEQIGKLKMELEWLKKKWKAFN
ncbi:MAG: transposase [Simkania sp.]|nr:transposase [Simkania sp.]